MPPHGDCENDNLKIQRKKYTHKHKTQVIQLIEYTKSLSFGLVDRKLLQKSLFWEIKSVCLRAVVSMCDIYVYNTFSSIHTRYTKGTMN